MRLSRKVNGTRESLFGFLLAMLAVCPGEVAAEDADLVGVTWSDSVLVSFDPQGGAVAQRHAQLNPYEGFRALAYDRNHGILYALTQGTQNLYAIQTDSAHARHIGNLRIDKLLAGFEDAGALAYDARTDTLYTAVEHWQGPGFTQIWSELCKVDATTGALTPVGRIDGPFIESLAFDEVDGSLYGLAVFGAGPWDSPDKAHVVRIDPETAAMQILFETPYHTMLGLAMHRPYSFISWVNWTTQFYGETDLVTGIVTPLAPADEVGVVSAMFAKEFPLGRQVLPIPPAPATFEISGRIDIVWDPHNALGGRTRPGQRFSGYFTYDAAAPYKLPDPNATRPYGISVHVGGARYAAEGVRATVHNNYYSAIAQTVSDGFQLEAATPSNALISWVLSDSTAAALDGNDRLPLQFNLPSWDRNGFVITGLDSANRPLYYLYGSVDLAVRRSSISAFRRPSRR